MEFPVPTIPARYVQIDPADQPAVDVFRETWEAIIGFYLTMDVSRIEPTRTLSDGLVEVWTNDINAWHEQGAVSGAENERYPSWQRIEEVRRIDAETVEITYCNFVGVILRDANGAVVVDGNPFLSRETAVMRTSEGRWYWSELYNDADQDGGIVKDCAWS